MKINMQRAKGFTLVEVISVLVLGGMALIFASMLFVTSTNIFVDSKNAAKDSQKLQAVLNRLVKELTFAKQGTVVVTNGRTIQWVSNHPDHLGQPATVTWNGTSGSSLRLFTTSLFSFEMLDTVGVFQVSSTADTITITLSSSQSEGVQLSTTVHPRYDG